MFSKCICETFVLKYYTKNWRYNLKSVQGYENKNAPSKKFHPIVVFYYYFWFYSSKHSKKFKIFDGGCILVLLKIADVCILQTPTPLESANVCNSDPPPPLKIADVLCGRPLISVLRSLKMIFLNFSFGKIFTIDCVLLY